MFLCSVNGLEAFSTALPIQVGEAPPCGGIDASFCVFDFPGRVAVFTSRIAPMDWYSEFGYNLLSTIHN